MGGERLIEFDIDLCAYVVGNLRQYLRCAAERPIPGGMLRPCELEMLDFPQWFARKLRGKFAPLADRIWAGVFGDEPREPLSESELYELIAVLDDMPSRVGRACVWVPFPTLHAQYVECLPEIRIRLSGPTAEEWAAASVGFSAQLCHSPLSLAEGVSAVGDWVRLARRLRHAMGTAVPSPATASITHAAQVVRNDSPAEQGGTVVVKGRATPAKPLTTGMGDAAVCGWREAMEVTGLKKTKLYAAFRDGVLKGYRDGKMIRFYRKGLTDYMRERENITLPPPRPVRRPRAGKSKAIPGMRFRFL